MVSLDLALGHDLLDRIFFFYNITKRVGFERGMECRLMRKI